jgi:thiol-disulfide isomerase/thioredoxin
VRGGLGLLVIALALSSVSGRDADEITMIPADGGPAWSIAVPGGTSASGAPVPLLAPTWFAKLPNATVALAPSGSFDLASARGKVLLLDYWASWCAPCLKELPHLERLHAARSGDGLVALAVNVDQGPEAAAQSAKTLGLTMMIGVADPVMNQEMGVRTLPTLFAVDKQGRLRTRWDGYRTGVETEIAATIDKLLADDATGTTREVASVIAGPGRLRALWYRDLPGQADGVVGLPGGAELLSFDAEGDLIARLRTGSAAGRLLDFGTAADDTREVVGFRTGGTTVDVIALRSGSERTITVPSPILDVAVFKDAGGVRRIAIATMGGAALASGADDRAKPVEGASDVRSVVSLHGTGALALREGGKLGPLLGSAPAWARPAAGAEILLEATDRGAVAATRSVSAAVAGRFLPGDGRQIAVATYSGHLALLDEASGSLLFDAIWSGVRDLAATDLDGDGRDELFVASGRSVTALGAGPN